MALFDATDPVTGKVIPIYVGKRKPDFNVADLSTEEEGSLKDVIDRQIASLSEINEKLGDLVSKEAGNVIDAARIFKHRANLVNYSGTPQQPGSGELGMQPIMDQDIEKDGSKSNILSMDVTAGTREFIWGGPTVNDFMKTDDPSGPGAGYAVYIVKGGILQLNDMPVARQMEFNSDEVKGIPYVIDVVRVESIDPDRTIYHYNTPGGYFLRWDIGTNLSIMPRRDATGVEYKLLGFTFYEREYLEDLKWL